MDAKLKLHLVAGAAVPLGSLPKAEWLLAGRAMTPTGSGMLRKTKGYGLASQAEIPPPPIKHDKRRCKRRNGIQIAVARPEHWRRVACHHERCWKAFRSAIGLAATGMFWQGPKNSC